MDSTVENCHNEGNILGESIIGGIVGGCLAESKVISCYNKGSIDTNGSQVYKGAGGIVGGIYGDSVVINGCYNNGNTDATNCGSGGIVGQMYSSSSLSEAQIINCCNNGNISNKNRNAGGIIGFIELASRGSLLNLNMENCYNLADVNSAQASGGMIGCAFKTYETATSNINISNCYNVGTIKGNIIGEIIGRIYSINQENFTVSSNYYIEKRNNAIGQGSATETNVESKSQQYMKTNEFVELLNSNIDSTNLKKWKLGTNGYPTFLD